MAAMTANVVITLVGIMIASATALAVAYLHRKQMRQIELYRADPSVGLIPPSTAFTKFLKSKGVLLMTVIGCGVSLGGIIVWGFGTGPITRGSLVWVELNVGECVFLILMYTVYTISSAFLGAFRDQSEINKSFGQLINLIGGSPEKKK